MPEMRIPSTNTCVVTGDVQLPRAILLQINMLSSQRTPELHRSLIRRERLHRLLMRVAAEGSASFQAQADRLGVSVDLLQEYLTNRPLPDDIARDIEWALHLPDGWLDGTPDASHAAH
jgi:hypothetical protein